MAESESIQGDTEDEDPATGYRLREGIYRPRNSVIHREDEYESLGFDILARMQSEHFWYIGRHRFLSEAVRRQLSNRRQGLNCRVIDLGGGCGGWLASLAREERFQAAELALADSSEHALRFSETVLPKGIQRYQIDLMDLQFDNCWDIAFLLDVLEHLPDHETALRQIHAALTTDGLLFVTVPALQAFWTWNDDAVNHQRRYCRGDFNRLADRCGFELLDARYFMFLLSPLVLASRWLSKGAHDSKMPEEEKAKLLASTHATPHPVINGLLAGIFASETPLGHHLKFPWGTSLLAVMKKKRLSARTM